MPLKFPDKRIFSNGLGTVRAGLLLALGAGLLVTAINSGHGMIEASLAGLKQFSYSTSATLLLMPIYESLSERVRKYSRQEILPVIVPALISITATYAMHRGLATPEPEWSTLPTVIVTPISFLLWHLKRRYIQEKPYTIISEVFDI